MAILCLSMSDYRFDDIVELQKMTGSNGEYGKAICKECSTVHKCKMSEFDSPRLVTLSGDALNNATPEHCYYVAQMRAWACCFENEEPLDGFPEEPPSLFDVSIEDINEE